MIEDVRRVITVVNEGSITGAAKKLFLTQPALSHAIKRVEKSLGKKIFRLEGKKIVLTNIGKEAIPVMERILNLWDGMREDTIGTYLDTCSIGVYDNAAILLSSLFKKYIASSELSLEMIIDTSDRLYAQLKYGFFDICVCVLDPNKSLTKDIVLVKSYSEPLIAVSSRAWLGPLEKMPFILFNRDSITRKYIDQTFVRNNIESLVIAASSSPVFIKELAIVGSGVALLPENFVKDELKHGKLQVIQLPLKFARPIGIYNNKSTLTPQKKLLVEEITTILQP